MPTETYEYIQANIDCGTLTWNYKVNGCPGPGSMDCEEDISGWTDEQIMDLTCTELGLSDDERSKIEIIWH